MIGYSTERVYKEEYTGRSLQGLVSYPRNTKSLWNKKLGETDVLKANLFTNIYNSRGTFSEG